MNEVERSTVNQMVSALNVARFELTTLYPRLTETYRKPVETAIHMCKAATAAAEEILKETK